MIHMNAGKTTKEEKLTVDQPPDKTEPIPSSSAGKNCFITGCIAGIVIVIALLVLFILLWKYVLPKINLKAIVVPIIREILPTGSPALTQTPVVIQYVVSPTAPAREGIGDVTGREDRTAAGSYIIPYSDSRMLTRSNLAGLSDWELKIARNEIYARHGRPFVYKDMSCYFDSMAWYRKDPNYTDARLTATELTNAVFILNYEKEIGSTIYGVDTGCR